MCNNNVALVAFVSAAVGMIGALVTIAWIKPPVWKEGTQLVDAMSNFEGQLKKVGESNAVWVLVTQRGDLIGLYLISNRTAAISYTTGPIVIRKIENKTTTNGNSI